MGKNKLLRFQENRTFSHLIQVSHEDLKRAPFYLKGKWREKYFRNQNPLVLELGCGKGEYTTGLAGKYPYKNFIGIDIKGARLWRGCKTTKEMRLDNVAFIRSRIQHIEEFFAEGEVDEIWITFPDPQPRQSKAKKRLTSPEFLEKYRNIMKKDGVINLKTDDKPLYQYTLSVIEDKKLNLINNDDDLYRNDHEGDAKEIKTFYEKIWLSKGSSIKYIKFGITPT